MNSGAIVRAVARHMNFHQGLLVPEAVVDCDCGWDEPRYYGYGRRYQADLMWVTKDNYATEIEIKVSRADWRADKEKAKWGMLPGWVARFIYAVPQRLGIPDFIHPQAGVWHVTEDHWHPIRVVRAPGRIGKQKVPPWLAERWRQHLYCRYWQQHLSAARTPKFVAAAD